MDIQKHAYNVLTSGICINLSIMILVSLIISVFPLLLNVDTAVFYTSQSFYIAVILLFVVIMYYKSWGLLVGTLTFMIYGIIIDLPLGIMFTNTIANVFQLLILLLSYNKIRKIKIENRNKYNTGEFFLNVYNFLLMVLFIFYMTYVFSVDDTNMYIICGFSILTFFITIIKIILEKDIRLFAFTILIALLPSLLSSSLSYYLGSIVKYTNDTAIKYICTWTLSNYVLFQTIGYWCYQYFFTRNFNMSTNRKNYPLIIDGLLYYVAIFVWNVLILVMIKSRIIASSTYLYFFPWALGNIFLVSNLLFSLSKEVDSVKDKFKWFEQRVIVVERNSSTIIMIVAFLLPMSLEYMPQSPEVLKTLFISNIFCICSTVGLIWTPKSRIKFISLLKTLKTIFYTYSISLTLLCVLIIMLSL